MVLFELPGIVLVKFPVNNPVEALYESDVALPMFEFPEKTNILFVPSDFSNPKYILAMVPVVAVFEFASIEIFA
jgi:hypothetical protein